MGISLIYTHFVNDTLSYLAEMGKKYEIGSFYTLSKLIRDSCYG